MKVLATLTAVTLALSAALAAQQDTVRPRGPGPHCVGADCPRMGAPAGGGMGMGMMQGHGGMGGGMGMMEGGPMARTMAFAPARLLEHREALKLSEQQVQRLTKLRDDAQQAHDAQHEMAMQYMEELGKLAGSTDTAAVRAAFMGHHQAMGGAHWIMLRAAVQARGILNEVQRARVDGWVDAMQEHRGPGMGQGMGQGMGAGMGPGPNRP